MKIKKLILLLSACVCLAACGMQGPLYLPKKQINTQHTLNLNKDKTKTNLLQ